MVNFRIIAIRTGKKPERFEIDPKYKVPLNPFRVLKENTIYSFDSRLSFPKDDFSEIVINSQDEFDLYSIDNAEKKLSVNVNAVVGGNGSGKSTLIELYNWANYNIGTILNILNADSITPVKPFSFLDLEIVYSLEHLTFIKLKFKDGKIFKESLVSQNNKIKFLKDGSVLSSTEDLHDFFYTLVVNNSHYALNEEEIGNWINPLFHKNDGYQTPIVLNPKREKGNIDVNSEKSLMTRRVVANLLEPVEEGKEENSLRNLVNGKIAKQLKVTYGNPIYQHPSDNPKAEEEIISAIYKYFGYQISKNDLEEELYWQITLNYLYEKLLKISNQYESYLDFKGGDSIKNIDGLIKELIESRSHISFKFKGAILYLKYYKEIFKPKFDFKEGNTIEISALSRLYEEIKKESGFFVNTFMMAPPSFLNVEIIPDGQLALNSFSSGEKQRIHSVSTVAYHLINLNSVEESKEKSYRSYINYKYVNVVLDEIELYFHPDWQRTYINDLINYISRIDIENLKNIKGLNITFVTHSPFILSDIPGFNVLYLDNNGCPIKEIGEVKTFGANIHEMLAHNFFLKNGFMGEFAKRKILSAIKYLEDTEAGSIDQLSPIHSIWSKETVRAFINLIGEPLIKDSLIDLHHRAFLKTGSAIDEEIKKLENLKRKLKNKPE